MSTTQRFSGTIAVTGATGQLGSQTVEFLLKLTPEASLVAMVRDPSKAQALFAQGVDVRQADYEDYSSLVKALTSVDNVLLVSSAPFIDRFAHHANVINAAKQVGVRHIAYTSLQRKNDTLFAVPGITETDIKTEQLLRESGLTYTILKNTLYADALPLFVGQQVLQTGMRVPIPAGEGRIAYATRRDMAEAAARVLTEPGHENQEYTLTGSESISFSEVADILSELTGKPVVHIQVAPEAYVDQLVGAGLPRPVAEWWLFWIEAYKRGMFEETDPMLTRLLGRQPTSIKDYLRSVYLPQTIETEPGQVAVPSYLQNTK